MKGKGTFIWSLGVSIFLMKSKGEINLKPCFFILLNFFYVTNIANELPLPVQSEKPNATRTRQMTYFLLSFKGC